MFSYEKKLQYPVNIKNPNPKYAQIIISHVLDGIEMAHEAKLPEQIIDFIRTHHGTRRPDYFYIMEQKEQAVPPVIIKKVVRVFPVQIHI